MSTPSSNQYAPPRSTVADIRTVDEDSVKATRLSRLAAAIVDGLIFSLPLAPAYFFAFGTLVHSAGRITVINLGAALAATGMLFYAGISIDLVLWVITAVLVHRSAQTMGKKLCGIQVVRTDGSRATLGRIFWLRNVLNGVIGVVPLVGPFYTLIDLLMIFGEQRRCCHDYIADTIVIRA